MKFFDRLEKISNRIDELIWQAQRFIETGDWFAIYAITGIKRFRELSNIESTINTASAQGRNYKMDITFREASAEYAGKLVEVYNRRKFFWMARK